MTVVNPQVGSSHVGRSIVVYCFGSGFPLSFIAMSLTANQAFAQDSAAWPQWGQNPQHTGYLPVAGQSLQGKLLRSGLRSFHHARDGGIARRSLDALPGSAGQR